MPQLMRDIHVSGLKYVGESVDRTLTESSGAGASSGKYRRFSIPHNVDRHCLGYLEGPAASLTEDTRNGRGYILRLWQNVENSADFQEGMACATIIGENDHPEERVDYSLTKGSIVLTDWEIREDEGIVWARFAILDNDEGRTLLSYVKFGTIIGVSSRGLGDEIVENGRVIIDPDTYEFYCFDAVAFPAATVARTKFVEKEAVKESISVKEAFSQRIVTETKNATTESELLSLKNVVESTNVPDKDSLVDSISHKLSSLSESADDQSNTGDEAGAEDSEKQILLSNLAEKDSTIDSQAKEIAKTKDLLKRRGQNANYFRRVVQEQQEEIESLTADLTDCLESVAEVSTQLESANADIETLRNSLEAAEQKVLENQKQAEHQTRVAEHRIAVLKEELHTCRTSLTEALRNGRKQANLIESIQSDFKEARDSFSLLESKFAEETANSAEELKNAANKLKEDEELIEDLRSKIASLKNFNTKLTSDARRLKSESMSKTAKSRNQATEALNGYLRKCCEAAGLDMAVVKSKLNENFTMKDIDKLVSDLADRQARFDMLPITLTPSQGIVLEHNHSNAKPEGGSFVVEALKRGH